MLQVRLAAADISDILNAQERQVLDREFPAFLGWHDIRLRD